MPQPGYGPRRGQTYGSLPWIIGGGVVLIGGIVLLVVLLVVLLSGGRSAEATGEAYAAALNDRDVEAARALICEHDQDDLGDDLAEGLPRERAGRILVEFVSATENGDVAVATFRLTRLKDDRTRHEEVPMAKVDGDWFICSSRPARNPFFGVE